ncbi:MAG: chorismate-binding protein [Bacteroidota bacterium]
MEHKINPFVSENKEELVYKLIENDFGFAAWRMPNKTEIQLIISLEKPKQYNSTISEFDTGFIINQYQDNHPIKPFYIKADIILKEKGTEADIDPRVGDKQLDGFTRSIASPQSSKPELNPDSSFPNALPNSFKELVQQAIEEIKLGQFQKVVLSRYEDLNIPEGFSSWNFFQLVCNEYPNAFCSLSFIPEKGLWVGATPELLISNNEYAFQTVALAGTKKLKENQSLSEITWTQKEIEEQAFVSRYIINCFKKLRLREFYEHGPKAIKAGHLAHLKTMFRVNYQEILFEELEDQMVELLHPTSAVCGMPIETTKPWILSHEGYDREFYAGFLGPVNFERSTDLFVNLRCAKISNDCIRFYAGAGITEDSNPKKEFEETVLKMNVLKNLM